MQKRRGSVGLEVRFLSAPGSADSRKRSVAVRKRRFMGNACCPNACAARSMGCRTDIIFRSGNASFGGRMGRMPDSRRAPGSRLVSFYPPRMLAPGSCRLYVPRSALSATCPPPRSVNLFYLLLRPSLLPLPAPFPLLRDTACPVIGPACASARQCSR